MHNTTIIIWLLETCCEGPKIKPSVTMFYSGGFGGNFYSNDGYGGNYSHSGSVDWWGN